MSEDKKKTQIKRDVGDKLKGFVLQRYKAVKYLFDKLESNPKSKLLVAVEYEGDVFLKDANGNMLLECKNYSPDSKFTINSKEIWNTLVYFIHYWAKLEFSETANFGFYATTNYTKERETDLLKELEISLPSVDSIAWKSSNIKTE